MYGVQTLLRGPTRLEVAAPYVSGEVLPISSQPVTRLCEAVRKTRAWVDDVIAARSEDGSMELAAAEALLARAAKIPMHTDIGKQLVEAVGRACNARDIIRGSLVPYAPVASAKEPEGDAAAVAAVGEKGLPLTQLSAKAPADVEMADVVDGEGSGGSASAGDQENAQPQGVAEPMGVMAGAVAQPKPPRMQDRDFKELQQLAATLKLNFPELRVLAETGQRVEAWKERARAAVAARTALHKVEELMDDAAALPVACAEADHHAGVIAAARKWIMQARAAIGGRRPLKEMRKLLHTGERMPVEMEEAEELKQCIRRREWEDTAAKVLAGKGTASAAAGILADAPLMGVAEDSRMVLALTAALADAEAWDSAAVALIERRGAAAAGDLAGGAPTLDEIAARISEASALRLRPERQSLLVTLQTQAHGWLEDCTRKMAPIGKPPAMAVVEALAATGAALGIALRQLTDLQAQLRAARQVSADSAALLAQPAAAEQTAQLEALRATAAALPVVVPEVEGLQARAAALAWEARVRRLFGEVLEPPAEGRGGPKPKLGDVCNAVEEARELEVSDSIRVTLRDAALQALVWETTATMLLGEKRSALPSYAVFGLRYRLCSQHGVVTAFCSVCSMVACAFVFILEQGKVRCLLCVLFGGAELRVEQWLGTLVWGAGTFAAVEYTASSSVMLFRQNKAF